MSHPRQRRRVVVRAPGWLMVLWFGGGIVLIIAFAANATMAWGARPAVYAIWGPRIGALQTAGTVVNFAAAAWALLRYARFEARQQSSS